MDIYAICPMCICFPSFYTDILWMFFTLLLLFSLLMDREASVSNRTLASSEKVDFSPAFPHCIHISEYFCSAALCHWLDCVWFVTTPHSQIDLLLFLLPPCPPPYGSLAWIVLRFPIALVSNWNSSSIPIVFPHSFFCHFQRTHVFILEGTIYKAKLVWC